MNSQEVNDRIQALMRKRQARRDASAAERDVQRLEDLEAVDALEERLGDINVVTIEIDAGPGFPTMMAGRVPTSAEYACYRDGCKSVVTRRGVTVTGARVASTDLGLSCLEYPPAGDARSRLLKHRPALLETLGAKCAERAAAQKEEEGKE